MNHDYHPGGPGTAHDSETATRRESKAHHCARVISTEIDGILTTAVPVVDADTPEKCYRYILPDELRCHHCGAYPPAGLSLELLERWVWLRTMWRRPIAITSAYRCTDHPAEKNKNAPGDHTLGIALDLALYDDPLFLFYVQVAFRGCRLLLASDHIHVTPRPGRLAVHP